MNADEVARLFDDRPGFRIVDFEEVGLPVYRLVSTVLTLQPKAYSPIEEFVLRAVEAGLNRTSDVAGFLGINDKIVEGTASTLIKDDEIVIDPDGEIRLTPKSQRVLNGEQLIRPREQSLVFWFDGLTRQPVRTDDLRLLEPRHLKEKGIREIRPFPAKRPSPDEIRGEKLQRVLRTPSQANEPTTQILQVKSISKAFANFIPAFALVYRSTSSSDVQVGFVIDGRLSMEHERAFAIADGPARLGITAAILKPVEIKDETGFNLPIGPTAGSFEVSYQQRQRAIQKFQKRLTAKAANAEPGQVRQDSSDVKMVAVYDHPPLLREALEDSTERLIIISPWITDAVVDQTFLKRLKRLLGNGVQVHIGYGLGEDAGRPAKAIDELERLAREHSNFSIKRLGDTHAKVLVKDAEWFVTTSFNWLSFRGDPKRTFREEWGTRVAIPEQVESYAQKLLKRLMG